MAQMLTLSPILDLQPVTMPHANNLNPALPHDTNPTAFQQATPIPAHEDDDHASAFGGSTQEEVLLLIALGSFGPNSKSVLSQLSRDIVEHTLVPAVDKAFWASRFKAGLLTPPTTKRTKMCRPKPSLLGTLGVGPNFAHVNRRTIRPSNSTTILSGSVRSLSSGSTAFDGSEFRTHGGVLADRFSLLQASARRSTSGNERLLSWGHKR